MKSLIAKWLRRFDIYDRDGGLYLTRWHLVRFFGRKIMLHRMVAPDYAREPHDHPWGFITIVLWGGYVEGILDPDGTMKERVNRPGHIRANSSLHAHVVTKLLGKQCWTLILRGKRVRQWGFYTQCGWQHFKTFCDKIYNGMSPC